MTKKDEKHCYTEHIFPFTYYVLYLYIHIFSTYSKKLKHEMKMKCSLILRKCVSIYHSSPCWEIVWKDLYSSISCLMPVFKKLVGEKTLHSTCFHRRQQMKLNKFISSQHTLLHDIPFPMKMGPKKKISP